MSQPAMCPGGTEDCCTTEDWPCPYHDRKHSMSVLPTDPATRKAIPMATGLLDYFPGALAEVAIVSKVGNDQHNPGQPMHWSRGKSSDHADTIVRHLADRGKIDSDGVRHSAKVAWRALALLQEELEAEGAQPGRGSRFPDDTPDPELREWRDSAGRTWEQGPPPPKFTTVRG